MKLPRKPAPYGRRSDSAPLIGDPEWDKCPAEFVPFPDGEKRQIPMPRGGVRWLLACPPCGRWVKDLYVPMVLAGDFRYYKCRHCYGLRYPSQYRGRRPECDPDRMVTLLDSAIRAGRRGNRALAHKRGARFLAAMDSYSERKAVAEIAEMEHEWELLQRNLARIDRQERAWKRRQGRKRRKARNPQP